MRGNQSGPWMPRPLASVAGLWKTLISWVKGEGVLCSNALEPVVPGTTNRESPQLPGLEWPNPCWMGGLSIHGRTEVGMGNINIYLFNYLCEGLHSARVGSKRGGEAWPLKSSC